MSATLNEQKLRHYFASRTLPSLLESPAPSLDVGYKKMKMPSRFFFDDLLSTYKMKHLTVPDFQINSPALEETCMKLAKVIIDQFDEQVEQNGKLGAVLVFLPGINEIQEMREFLMKDRAQKKIEWKIIPLHSSIPWEEHQLVFEPAPLRTRKIVLATTIAER